MLLVHLFGVAHLTSLEEDYNCMYKINMCHCDTVAVTTFLLQMP